MFSGIIGLMLMVIHVVLACLALGVSLFNFAKPLQNRLKTSYSLAVGTLASGVLLIVINNASILRTCVSGIAFFAVVTVLNELTRQKLTEN